MSSERGLSFRRRPESGPRIRSGARSSLRSDRGFTMIEVVVMMTIVAIGLLSTLTIANVTIRTSDENENRVAAVNLAREGIELVRTTRDSNWQAYSREKAAGRPEAQRQPWDCYVDTPDEASAYPMGCDAQFRTNTTPVNYAVYPNLGNGQPYFVSNGAAATQSDPYLICPDATGVYGRGTPVLATKQCQQGGRPFYRRISVGQGRNLGNGNYSIRVRSYVSWPGKRGGDVVIETYLADWRKF